MPAEARQHLPMIEAALDHLRTLPDCTLVEVDGPDEHVRVRVRDGKMVVDVNDSGDEVHVTLPMGSLRSVMSKLQSAAQYASAQRAGDGDEGCPWSHDGHQGAHPHGSEEID